MDSDGGGSSEEEGILERERGRRECSSFSE